MKPERRVAKGALARRKFLGAGISAAAVSAVSCNRSTQPGAGWRFFTSDEARTVEAICEQIIPADQDAGAKEAGVVSFIDLQLSRPYRRHRAIYRQGIAGVDDSSRSKYGKPFAGLNSEQQVDVLNAAEENNRAFFELILSHTRQGFYGDPRHGGNRNRVSWKMVGLPFPPVRGREHYQG